MFGGRLGAPEIIIIAVLLIVVFGWKRLPDAARSLGRSARVFKSEVDEMKKDGSKKDSPASGATVPGEAVRPSAPVAPADSTDPVDRTPPTGAPAPREDAPRRPDGSSGPPS